MANPLQRVPHELVVAMMELFVEELYLLKKKNEPFCSPLKNYTTGTVQIDFVIDGSLKALDAKLKENAYHILHFSGHSTYQDGTTWLELEEIPLA